MKKNIIIPAIIAFLAFSFASCKKEELKTYTGPDLVEFSNAPNNTSTTTRTITTTTTPKLDSIKVQLVGPQRSTPTTVNYTIDAASTAVSGTDYVEANPGKTVIPAYSNEGWIKFTFNKVATSGKKLIIKLTGGDAVIPSENYKTFTYTLN